jgi:hypothetical protein
VLLLSFVIVSVPTKNIVDVASRSDLQTSRQRYADWRGTPLPRDRIAQRTRQNKHQKKGPKKKDQNHTLENGACTFILENLRFKLYFDRSHNIFFLPTVAQDIICTEIGSAKSLLLTTTVSLKSVTFNFLQIRFAHSSY